MKTRVLIFICIVLFSADNSVADTGVFWGIWKTIPSKISVDLTIKNDKDIILKINNETIKDLDVGFCYGAGHLPFLSITSSDGKTWHSIYLAIGGEGESKPDRLRGFYERAKLIDEQREISKTIYFPIELMRVARPNSRID